MEHFTFEQLPQAISQLHEKISHIEQVLLERQPQPETMEVFNVSQAAAYLNLTVATLYTKVSRQEIPVNKRGKRLYFYKGELASWIREGRQKTISEIRQESQDHIGIATVYWRFFVRQLIYFQGKDFLSSRGGDIPKPNVSFSIIPALDILKNGKPDFLSGGKFPVIDQLSF